MRRKLRSAFFRFSALNHHCPAFFSKLGHEDSIVLVRDFFVNSITAASQFDFAYVTFRLNYRTQGPFNHPPNEPSFGSFTPLLFIAEPNELINIWT